MTADTSHVARKYGVTIVCRDPVRARLAVQWRYAGCFCCASSRYAKLLNIKYFAILWVTPTLA